MTAALALLALIAWKPAQKIVYPVEYSDIVQHWAQEYDVDPFLVFAVIETESSFNVTAESSVGARGLMQMMEETFYWLAQKIAPDEELTFEDLFTPEISIRFGVCYLSMCLERYTGDVDTAAAAYHSGWGTVDRLLADEQYSKNGVHLSKFPYRQMNHYVNKINKSYKKYTELYATEK